MRNTVALLALALTLATGCYAGRTPARKTTAYVVNGLGMVVGTAIVASMYSAESDSSECANVNEGTACGFGQLGSFLATLPIIVMGGGMAAASTAMVILTAAVPTEREAAPMTVQRGASGVVSAPGLKPATIVLR
jgi:hypothetical protein